MKTALFLALFVAANALAQEEASQPPEAPTPPAAPCSSEKHRQFDFWVGEWDVTEKGQPAGHNNIVLVHGDCALNENWTSARSNFSGASFNMYVQANDKWHQTWVDANGSLLQLDGAFADGKMVLSGERPSRGGSGKSLHRITWTPSEDGSVRQLWEVSNDSGNSWSVLFDGLYEKQDQGL